jgi:cytoskeletal protein CcmA (bactofilin family)
MAQIIDLGKLRFVFKGAYSGSTTYELNDVVRYGGNLYVYKYVLETTANLPTNATYWDLMLEGIDFKGVYNIATAYKIGDLVTEGAKGFICIADTTGNRPPNGTYWATIVDGTTYEGAYAGGTTYQPGDVVSYGGSAYICTLRTTGNAPTDVTYWDLFVNGAYPDQTSAATYLLTTNGTSAAWTTSPTLTTLTTRSDITVNGDADIKGSVTATSRSIDVNYKVIASNVATLTTDGPHYFDVGDRVGVTGVGAGYNGGAYTVTAVTSNTFSYATSTASSAGAAVSPVGTATVQGDISTTGKLDVTGVTTLTGALNANGGIVVNTNKFTVNAATGDTVVDGLLHVEGTPYLGTGAQNIASTNGANVRSTTFKARTSDVATITTQAAHGFFPFQYVTVSIGDATFDGDHEVIATPTATTFTYTSVGTNLAQTAASGSGLQVGAMPGFTNLMAFTTIDAADDYAQFSIQNTGAGTSSSSDFIAYPDNGTDFSGYIDMGITSSTFDDPEFTITGPNDGYIFMTAPAGSSGKGNLVLATGGYGTENKIVFAAGGLDSNNEQMSITPDVNVHIEIPTASTSATTGALTVVGGVGISGDMNIAGNVNIVGAISFGGSGTTVTTNNLSVGEPMIFSGAGNQADIIDEGLVVEYGKTVTAITNTVTNKALTSNVATLTTGTAHTYRVGDVVTISSVDATFNGVYSIATIPTSTTFTYAKTATNVVSAAVSPAGGTSVAARREFAGVVRDATDGNFKMFTGAVTKPATTVNFAEAGLTYANLQINNSTVGGTLDVTGTATFNGNVTILGTLRMQELTEDVVDVALSTNVASLDYTLGSVFWITSTPSGAMTWSVTNAPTTDGRTFTITGFVTQGGTGYIPSTLNVNGSAVTIRWLGAVAPTPTSTSGRIDIFNFTLVRRGGSYIALGNATPNFG